MTPWWEDAVIYQVYPRSFADSDGDGIGDLPGVTAHLPYLKDLGVDALWLTPFYPSPMADGGYDVANFTDVDPRFGTLSDFDDLVATAHSLDLKIIVDIVPNHSSDQHPWFQAALASTPNSPERARYIFRRTVDGKVPTNWQSYFGGSTWEQLDDGDWYLHSFAVEQPDFNWEHPDVKMAFIDTLKFWGDRGVDGFRIDVAHGMAKDLDPLRDIDDADLVDNMLEAQDDTHHPFINVPAVHDIYRTWRPILDSFSPPRMAVAEAWVPLPELAKYVRDDELHQAFGFEYLLSEFDATQYRDIIRRTVATLGANRTTWVLSNHDVVRHASRFALPSVDDASDWVNSHGTQPHANAALGLARARASILLSLALPGAIYLYQGEELGLPEVPNLPDEVLEDPTFARTHHEVRGRDGCRVPLPWTSSGPSLGFSDGLGWLPQPAAFAALSVEAQVDDSSSMLSLYRAAIARRKDRFTGGTLEWPDSANTDDVLTLTRGTTTAVVINTGAKSVRFDDLGLTGDVVLASETSVTGEVLPANASVWLDIK